VGDELVGDGVDGHLGHVEPPGVDQLEEQVERAGEVGQVDGERPRIRHLVHGSAHLPRWMTSRASAR